MAVTAAVARANYQGEPSCLGDAMSEPSDKSTISSQPTNEQLEELSAQELDGVTGGDGKTQTKSPKVEALKETITFEYGGLAVQYTPQKPD
jgi:hypothetical protein